VRLQALVDACLLIQAPVSREMHGHWESGEVVRYISTAGNVPTRYMYEKSLGMLP